MAINAVYQQPQKEEKCNQRRSQPSPVALTTQPSSIAATVLQLQRSHGNYFVQQLLQRSTAKPTEDAESEEWKTTSDDEIEDTVLSRLAPSDTRQIQRVPDDAAVPMQAQTEQPQQTDAGSPPQPQADQQQQADAGSTSQPQPPAPCTPTPLSRPDYLTQPGTTQNDFGLTTLSSGSVTFPVVQVTRVRGGVRVEPTNAGLASIPSVFTQAGTFTEGETLLVSQDGGCPSRRYPIRWTITPGGAQKIAQGEQEHCADFQYAFQISLQRYADAVNQLAASRRVFGNQAQVERQLTRTLGVAPADWPSVFLCLAHKTLVRDRQNWHTPRPQRIAPSLQNNCAYATYILTENSCPQIGQHPSSSIIRGCGEAQPPQ